MKRIWNIGWTVCVTLLLSVLCGMQVVHAEEQEFTYNEGSATYTFTNTGALVGVDGASGEVDLADIAEKAHVTLVSIRQDVFKYSEVTSVNLPASVQSIEENAFYWAKTLGEITYEKGIVLSTIGDAAFFQDGSLTDFHEKGTKADGGFHFPASLKTIGEQTFMETNPMAVTFQEGTTQIGDSAFDDCGNLSQLKLPDSLKIIGDTAFGATNIQTLELPAQLSKIGESAFNGVMSLCEVSFPENGTFTIGKLAFYNTGLKEVTLPAGCTQVGEKAFNCDEWQITQLVSVKIQNDKINLSINVFPTITIIYANAGSNGAKYAKDNGNQSEVLPKDENKKEDDKPTGSDKSEEAGKPAGSDKTEVSTEVPETKPSDPGHNSAGTTESAIRENQQAEAVAGKQYTVGEFIYRIQNRKSVLVVRPVKKTITKGIIPDKVMISGIKYAVTGIGKKAFYRCKKLTQIKSGNSLQIVGSQAFAGCSRLKKITFGKGLKTIGAKCFMGDRKLARVVIRSKKLKKVGKGCMKNTSRKNIIVPASKKAAYQKLFRKAR
ncbi:MAG: leucine-rich repeat domain-containing protein [Clostridium sp.]|nr:leucine-rich repeat domain-containing protein [Clostridium sp.]